MKPRRRPFERNQNAALRFALKASPPKVLIGGLAEPFMGRLGSPTKLRYVAALRGHNLWVRSKSNTPMNFLPPGGT